MKPKQATNKLYPVEVLNKGIFPWLRNRNKETKATDVLGLYVSIDFVFLLPHLTINDYHHSSRR